MTKCIVSAESLYVHVCTAPKAYKTIKALDEAGVYGAGGEYDAPAEVALKKQFPNNTIVEWECLAVHAQEHYIVFENLRIIFKVKE